MKVLSILMLLSLSTLYLKGQTWLADGTEFSYCDFSGISTYNYTNDSLVDDTLYSVVRPTLLSNFFGASDDPTVIIDNTLLFRQTGDTIFRRVANSEYVYFINGLEIGDQFTTFRSGVGRVNKFSCDSLMELEVIDVNLEEIDGDEYRIVTLEDFNVNEIYIDFPFDNTSFSFSYIENVGLQFQFPFVHPFAFIDQECFPPAIDLNYFTFLSEFSSENEIFISDCELSAINQKKNLFSIYPNPSSGVLHIKWESSVSKIEYRIFDITGRTISSGIPSENFIDINHLPNGYYILKVETDSGHWDATKLIIKK